MNFVLPSKAQVGHLDAEIAGEGQKVILSDGEQVSWTPPPPRPVMPDWSQIKSIARYFGRTGHQVYPAWLYHKDTDEQRLVKNADEAGSLGVCYREATTDERGRYGLKAVWDWQDDSPWRPQPTERHTKFDPLKPGQGKTFQPAQQNPALAQNQMLEAMIPAVAAAVAQALKGAGGPTAPANIEPADWEAFLQFKAFQKAAEAVDIVKAETANPSEGDKPESEAAGKRTTRRQRVLRESGGDIEAGAATPLADVGTAEAGNALNALFPDSSEAAA